MAQRGFKILDSDMHVMEPPDLWERYIDDKYRSKAPRGVISEGHNFERNQKLYRSHAERGWTAEVQLEAMDIEGIDIAVLYPTRGLGALVVNDMEAGFAAAISRAYNNWLADFCQKDRERLIGAGMISPYYINDAIDEACRCTRELGFRAVFLRANPLVNHQWQDDYYDPL